MISFMFQISALIYSLMTPACFLVQKIQKIFKSKVNIELTKINQWRKFSRLSINFSKSFYMIFFNKKQNPKFNITMDGNTLIRTNDFK